MFIYYEWKLFKNWDKSSLLMLLVAVLSNSTLEYTYVHLISNPKQA